MTRILILCTGNSCRSQMAEGFLKSLDENLEVFSAGTEPAEKVHPVAVRVMREKGVDIGGLYPKSVAQLAGEDFDCVVTVCGGAAEACPAFAGGAKQRVHIGFDDPAKAAGTDGEVLAEFRRVRDEIMDRFREFYETRIRPGEASG